MKKAQSSIVNFSYTLPLTEQRTVTHKYYGVSQWNTCHRQEDPNEWRESTNAFFTQIELYRQKLVKVRVNPSLKKLRSKFKKAKIRFQEIVFLNDGKKWVKIVPA